MTAPTRFQTFEDVLVDPAFTESAYCGLEYAAHQLGLSPDAVCALVEQGALQGWTSLGGYQRIALASLVAHGRQVGGSPAAAQPLRVLVVEDDVCILELYRCQFELWNLPVDCTWMSSALTALMDIASIQPDLLITDVSMPGVDGIELLRGLTRNAHLSAMRIMVISGLPAEFFSQRGGVSSRIERVQKPVDFDWLRRYVTALTTTRPQVFLPR